MPNHRLSLRSTVARCLLLGALIAGCSDSNSPTQQDKDVASLRQAIASIQPLSAAQQAGYSVAVGDPTDGHTCLSDVQAGAMGVHYLNASLVSATPVVTQPQIMIYEPQQDGSTKFVGVEFIIPYSVHGEDQSPPELFGQQFMKNATFQLWGLHVWVGRTNPSGIFAMWNPDVTCQFAH
jgi:hypothetical protein